MKLLAKTKHVKRTDCFLFMLLLAFLMLAVSCSNDDDDNPTVPEEPEVPVVPEKPDTTTPEAGNAVDLGLSVMWADCNVGAEHPEEVGGLYGWGDATGEETEMGVWNEDYEWVSPNYGGPNPPASISGTKLDIASVKWGGNWRMPTMEEMVELRNRCTWEWTEINGVNGMTVTGPNGNCIFLPAAGLRAGDMEVSVNRSGNYWTGTLDSENLCNARCLGFNETVVAIEPLPDFRFAGHSVRPVKNYDVE